MSNNFSQESNVWCLNSVGVNTAIIVLSHFLLPVRETTDWLAALTMCWLTALTTWHKPIQLPGGWLTRGVSGLQTAWGLAGVSTNWLNKIWLAACSTGRHDCSFPTCTNGDHDHGAGRANQLSGFRGIRGPWLCLSALIQKNLSDLAACMQTHRHANPKSRITSNGGQLNDEMVWFSCGY